MSQEPVFLAEPGLVPLRLLGLRDGRRTELLRDEATSRLYVMRTVQADVPPLERARLAREVERQSDVRVHWEDSSLSVVRPYIPGRALSDRLLAGGLLSVREAIKLAADVLGQLRPLHTAGRAHRDLRPDTIVLADTADGGAALVLDLEFVDAPALRRALREEAPSVGYLAPEQSGVLDRPVDGRADLYALGLILFESLTGRRPFDGTDVRDVLHQHLSAPVPRVRAINAIVPRALDEYIARLLRKDPEDRPRDAAEGLAGLHRVALALHTDRSAPEPGPVLAEARMAGRSAQLSALLRRAEDARHGVASCAVVSGVSGGGKSRLLDEFASRAGERGAWILRGGGVEGAAQHPLQVLVGVVEGIVAGASAAPGLRSRLIAALAHSAATLRDVLPGLADVLPEDTDGHYFGESHARARAVTAITALLTVLGTVERPVVVLLDDCQWADELTVEVLTSFAREAQNGGLSAYLTLVVALRPEDVTQDHPLLTSPGLPRVDLPPLGPDEVDEVVRSMAGDVPPELPALVDELSRGEPLMIGAVLRGLVESGALSPTASGWTLTPPQDGWQASQESAAILGRRISMLDQGTRQVLQAGAVYGRSFTLSAVAALTGLSLGQAERAVRQAEERSLVWDAGDQRFTIVHDRLRASLLADIEPANLETLHRRVAEQIEASEPARAFELAHHFDAGAHADRALPYALRSAAIARSQHDLELAERNYRIAERGMSEGSSATAFEVSEMLGEILMLRGRYDESAERFERARALAGNELTVARMEGRLGELVFRRDDLEGAAAHLETGLAILGERIPRGSIAVMLRLTWELLRRMLRGLPGRRRGGGPAPTEKDLLRAHLYTQLQYPRWFKSQRMETMWLMVRQVNVAERCPNTPQLAHAYGVWGGSMALTVPFLWKRGLRYTEASEAISKAHHDVRGQGHAYSMRTCVLHAAGRYGEAEIAAAEAIKLLGEFGDRWETSFAARNRAMCLYRIGRMQEALEEASRVHRLGVDLGDANAEVTALEVLAKATDGRVRTAQTQQALRRQGADIEVRIASLQADALRLRHDGDLSGAISRLEHAAGIVRRARPTNTYLVPALAWLATVRREAAEREVLPGLRRRALWRARRDARRAVRYSRLFHNDRPHALRERGLVSALLGNSWRARRLLQRSIDVATDRAAWGEITQTRIEGERLGLELLIPIEAERAAPWDNERAERADLGLADRFEALLESGVRLAAADSEREIVAAVRDTAVSLLRADSCRVVGLTSAWNRAQADPSLAAAVDVLASLGRPIAVAPATELTPPELAALVPPGARSALAAPVLVGGETAGWFVAGHDQVGRLFGPDEERLAELVARLAGAALERLRIQSETKARIITAQEAERTRVARDLHDEIGQALTGVLLGVRLVESADPGDLHTRADELRRTVTAAIDSVQRLAFALRPAVLDDLGLVAALRRLTEQGHDLDVELETVDLDPVDRFAPEIETTAYRIVQESLTNVLRHSGATRCSIVAGRTQHRLRIVVEDDGRGFDRAAAGNRLGLRGMRERAELVGGTLRVDSEPGRGTSVVFEVAL